jgi:competence protein ComEA
MKKLTPILAAIFAATALAFAGTALAKDEPAKPATPAATPAKSAPAAAPAAERKAEPMDINTASEKELATLKGIGEARAKAIVKGRPYKGKDELVAKKIITEKVYADIKDLIIAKQAKEEKKEEKKADTKAPKK